MGAVLKLKRGDYSLQDKRVRLRLLEKGNREKLVWLHNEAEQYLDAYLEASNIHEAGAALLQMLKKTPVDGLAGLPSRYAADRQRTRAKAELPESI